jgi:hypothetical protein
MEGSFQQHMRTLKQCYQRCRIEEQILKLAYEHVCPQIRRPITSTPTDRKQDRTQRRVIKEGAA